MAIVSVSNSDEIHPAPIGGPEVRDNIKIAAALGAIPDAVSGEASLIGGAAPGATPEPAIQVLEPWALVNVEWVVPLAGKLLQLPYEQVAKRTRDECWLITDDQLRIINPALENALKWVIWKLGAANTISHPLVGFGVALGSLTAVKYGIYQYNESQRKDGGPQKQSPHRQPQANPQPINTDTSMTNGRTAEYAGASSSPVSPAVAKAGSSQKDFVVVGE